MTRLTALPPRPTFSEEAVATALPDGTGAANGTSPAAPSDLSQPGAAPDSPPVDDANAYQARVIQPIGLILRQGPDASTTQLGGIDYNDELTVLSESDNGEWIQVRLLGSEVIGWVKAGNTEPLDEPVN
ncbi:MAG: SH3 domain-containing protein [Elainellaceae cyanobacterium]